jgi:hypothetical protein
MRAYELWQVFRSRSYDAGRLEWGEQSRAMTWVPCLAFSSALYDYDTKRKITGNER